MKNSQQVTAWLDHCAETLRRIRSNDIDLVSSASEHSDEGLRLSNALVADGWTQAELDDFYAKRFDISKETRERWARSRR